MAAGRDAKTARAPTPCVKGDCRTTGLGASVVERTFGNRVVRAGYAPPRAPRTLAQSAAATAGARASPAEPPRRLPF